MVGTEGACCELIHFGPKAADLSGTEALGPLSSTAAMQPPAPMPRKSQAVSAQAPRFCVFALADGMWDIAGAQRKQVLPLLLVAGWVASSPGWGIPRTQP